MRRRLVLSYCLLRVLSLWQRRGVLMGPNYNEKEYRGYYICFNFYGREEYTVQYCGDDFIFKTEEDAKAFIDTLD